MTGKTALAHFYLKFGIRPTLGLSTAILGVANATRKIRQVVSITGYCKGIFKISWSGKSTTMALPRRPIHAHVHVLVTLGSMKATVSSRSTASIRRPQDS